jgi:unsaturated chondroitin disaccharide hydrolase
MIHIDPLLTPQAIRPAAERLFEVSAPKIFALQKRWDPARGAPVFTAGGRYTSRGWTEWTQGFQFGSAILQYDATGDQPGARHRAGRHAAAHGQSRQPRRRA